MKAAKDNYALLTADDPAPVEWVNKNSHADVLLLCEHAGNCLPANHGRLGLSHQQLNSHIGWDIGAASVARQLANRIHAPLILQRYSRLLIDCNRPPGTVDSIPEQSDGIVIPANTNLPEDEQVARQNEIFRPLNAAISEGLNQHQRLAVFSIHSFTPQMNGQQRPWHAGFLTRKDQGTAENLIRCIQQQNPELILAANEPYAIEDETDWFIPRFAEAHSLMHSLIEIRNDQLRDNAGIDRWADLLANAITTVMEDTQ